ncbi:MAG: cytidyltransferase-related domain protein, partial [Oscillospiraceae bacterium]|nr:cytidyltransferase-related domain protein [Oscillospiraceae bacterium]
SRLRHLLGSSNDRIVSVALNTVGRLIECYPEYKGRFPESDAEFEKRRETLAGMLLKGLAGYRETVRQEALLVFGKYIFGSDRLSHADTSHLFTTCLKKALFLMSENPGDELTFFYRAAALSNVYRFITLHRLDHGDFSFEQRNKIAFFPGTFDPFTLSHKGIVNAIRDLGFEVFLAVDEFSWSKKTQPHLIRRQIVSMSVADEFHVHIFPDDIPVNIANPNDLKRLHEVFEGYELYIAVGSDVVANASSYRGRPEKYSIHSMNHIVFRRESGIEGDKTAPEHNLSMITGDVIQLSLPCHLEDISSTRIRENIDLNRDISNLIDPAVQEFIYHNSLYLREPQYKATLRPQDIGFEYVNVPTSDILSQLRESLLADDPNAENIISGITRFPDSLMIMRDIKHKNTPIGFIRFCEIGSAELLRALGSAERADYIRRNANGRILIVRGIYARRSDKNFDYSQLLFTEVLTKALANDCGFALFFAEKNSVTGATEQLLLRQGFSLIEEKSDNHLLYTVDMRSPLVLIQNLETTIKEPFSSNEKVLLAIRTAHHRLQKAMTGLYPGNLVLSLSSAIIHHRLLGKITSINNVPEMPTVPRVLGRYMCVPFGKILRGKVVPNTVTKTLHTDKVFEPDLSKNSIEAFPYYTPLQSQMRTIRSFGRPVILVDDIMHSGDRWRAVSPLIKEEKLDVKTVLVGLLSGRGRDLMETQHQSVDISHHLSAREMEQAIIVH